MKVKFESAMVIALSGMLLHSTVITTHAQDPTLKQRPETVAPQADQGRFTIDVVVTDKQKQRVLGLTAQDFVLSDNQKPQKLISFSSVETTVVKTVNLVAPATPPKVSMEPTEVILMVDAVNMGLTQQSFIYKQTEDFLRSNGGKLAAPTWLLIFTTAGMQMQNQPTLNGNALADLLQKTGMIKSSYNSAMGDNGSLERYMYSEKSFKQFVQNMANRPSRKLLIWLGTGWPLITNDQVVMHAGEQEQTYKEILSIDQLIRDARMTIFSVRTDADDRQNSIMYQGYLKGVRKKEQADTAYLSLQVLAVRSGGRVTDPSNNLAGELARCFDEANSYYTLRFTPSDTGKPLSYHSIEVKVNRPGVVARSITGYYESP